MPKYVLVVLVWKVTVLRASRAYPPSRCLAQVDVDDSGPYVSERVTTLGS